jgi:hypothetical protein
MDDTSEKYPVCPERNTPAAFRWFYQPLNVLAYLKARRSPRPDTAARVSAQPEPARLLDRT